MSDLPVLLGALAAIGLVTVGALALISPQRLARSYGVAVSARSATAFVRATGARDLVLGGIFGATVYLQDGLFLLILAVAGFALALADFIIAFTFAGGFRSEQVAHLGGMVGFAIVAAVLWTRVV